MAEWTSDFPSAADCESSAEYYKKFLLNMARANRIPITMYKLRRLANKVDCENAATGTRDELYQAIADKIGWDALGRMCADVGIMGAEFRHINISPHKLRELVASGVVEIVGSYRYILHGCRGYHYNKSPLYSIDDYFKIKMQREAKTC